MSVTLHRIAPIKLDVEIDGETAANGADRSALISVLARAVKVLMRW